VGKAVLTLTVAVVSGTSYATTIDFEANAGGTPFADFDSFLAGEFAGLGVTITDSDPSFPGSTFINPVHPLNVGTAISGHHVNVGAFVNVVPTFFEFNFGPDVLDVAFDFATFDGIVRVLAYDSSDTEILDAQVAGFGVFITDTALEIKSGNVVIGALGPIARVRVEAENQGLILDNLSFTSVPEPGTLLLIGAGLVGAAAFRRESRPPRAGSPYRSSVSGAERSAPLREQGLQGRPQSRTQAPVTRSRKKARFS
jgi:hypothetical protein